MMRTFQGGRVCSFSPNPHVLQAKGRERLCNVRRVPGIIRRMINQNLYDVVTLFDCLQDPATRDWLAQHQIPLPGTIPPGRYPSPAEIKTVIESIKGIKANYVISQRVWQVSIQHRTDVSWAVLRVREYSGDSDAPYRFDFAAGWDEMIELVSSKLVEICGPLVLLPDSGELPKIFI